MTQLAVSVAAVSVPPSDQILPFRLLALGVVVLASLLIEVAVVTLGYSIRAARRRRRREPLRATLRSELLDRLYGRDDPEWQPWVDGLTVAARDELEPLLDVYLRELDGRDARTLSELGRALDVHERARQDIAEGGYWKRIRALTWLSLLRDAPDRDLLRAHCTETPRERAAAARVLYAAESDDCATTGVDLLLRDDPEPFSVFGVDTLYRVAERDPGPLFDRAAADFESWDPALQRQTLLAVRNLTTVIGGADLSWVVSALSSPKPRVRSAAWQALGAYGWNRRLRDALDLGAILDDPDSAVRASAYRALGVWGDPEAVAAVEAAGTADPDVRAQVAAAETLIAQRTSDGTLASSDPPRFDSLATGETALAADPDALDGDDAAPFDAAWGWATEHARFDRLARDISRDRERLYEAVRG